MGSESCYSSNLMDSPRPTHHAKGWFCGSPGGKVPQYLRRVIGRFPTQAVGLPNKRRPAALLNCEGELFRCIA